MRRELCVCAEIPRLEARTRVVILMHVQESAKPTNTGRLAHLCLPNSEIRYRGLPDRSPLLLDDLVGDEFETWMLHLSERSELLDESLAAGLRKPLRLLVLDGNWSQASRLGAKLARTLPPRVRHVRLSAGPPSEYRLRSEHHPDGLATFEAIARALGVLEGRELQARMEELFRKMTDRVLWTRGLLGAESVRGGIPGRSRP